MTEELAAILGEPETRLEKRQCLLKSVAAALLVGPEVPAEADVIALAAKLRLEMANNARAAERALGPAPDRVSPTEHELRVHLHDARPRQGLPRSGVLTAGSASSPDAGRIEGRLPGATHRGNGDR